MLNSFKIFFHLILIVYSLANKGKRFNCPNDGIPKEENGKIVQCLPGRASTAVCGLDHACFFSGFNYQCCPSSMDKDINDNADKEECTGNALVVLDSNGIPFRCDESGECPPRGMFCHGGICCEYFKLNGGFVNKEGENENQKAAIAQIRPVDGNITPKLESINNPTMLKMATTTKVVEYDKNDSLGLEESTTNSSMSSSNINQEELAQKMEENEKNNFDVSYKNGEYAPRKNLFDSSQPKNQIGELAKKFLLEQIKEGWPYNEKYYRPADDTEDIIVLRNRGRPKAIVHFPNWP